MTPAEMVADMRAAGMSGASIARAVGVPRTAVCEWQVGFKPSPYARARLAALHAHLDGWAVAVRRTA